MGGEPSTKLPALSESATSSDLSFRRAPYGVLQLGEGRFLRGFSVPLFQHLSRQARRPFTVLMVNNRASGLPTIQGLQRQDGLYTVVTQDDQGERLCELMRNVVPKRVEENWAEVVAAVRQPNLVAIVTNGTEAGLVPVPEEKWPEPPGEGLVSRLTLLLWERWQVLPDHPLNVLPTELVSQNGRRLLTLVVDGAHKWHAPEAFIHWLVATSRFVNTVVDRIVTGMPSEPGEYWRACGYRDDFLTLGEAYGRWWIEGRPDTFPHLDLWALPEVQLVRDIRPYESLKLYGLNGAHVAIAAVGLREGFETVAEALDDRRISLMVDAYWEVVGRTVALPKAEILDFLASTRHRFGQRWLHHRLQDIAANLPGKWRQRIKPLMDEVWAAQGVLVSPLPEISLAVAAWTTRDAPPRTSCEDALARTLLGVDSEYPPWWTPLLRWEGD